MRRRSSPACSTTPRRQSATPGRRSRSQLRGSPAFAGDVDAGAQVFATNCAACHAGGNNVIRPEMTLKREALEAYLSGGLKENSVVNQVVNGRNAMPAFGGRLEDQEIENVASYVIDQAVGGKWDTFCRWPCLGR